MSKRKEIKINSKGVILEGDNKGWHVFIEDDAENTGGYLILKTSQDLNEGYDNWVENLDDLQSYFQESNWKIKWLDD